MTKIRKMLLLTILVLLLAGIVSATSSTEKTTTSSTNTINIAEETTTVSQADTNTKQIKINEYNNQDENKKSTTKTINKKKDKTDTKKDTITVNDWEELEKEINKAKSATKNTTITLEEGTYKNTGTLNWNNPNIILTINGNGQSINGNQKQVLNITEKSTLILENININNAKTTEGGGAIKNYGQLTIHNSTFESNKATVYGGAIYNVWGKLKITNSVFNKNTGCGGAIYNDGGNTTIQNSSFNNNKAELNYGGATVNSLLGRMTIDNSTFNNNYGNYYGGAIFNMGNMTVNNMLTNNNSAENGGSIYNYGNITIHKSIFTNNNATIGGAIYNNIGNINITENTLKQNTAKQYGGAIMNIGSDSAEGTIKIDHTNIEENHAINASAIYSTKNTTNSIHNTNFTNNRAENGETLILDGKQNLTNNKYNSTDILLKTEHLTVKDNQEEFQYHENVTLNYTIKLENPQYYDKNILEETEYIILNINEKENRTTKYENYTLTQPQPGEYHVYYTAFNKKSNTIKFTVTGNSSISTDKKTYNYYNGSTDLIKISITDDSPHEGQLTVSVKNNDEYLNLLSFHNIKDEYTIATETIVRALENNYNNISTSYQINLTYNKSHINSSTTEIILNIYEKKNTTITINPINSSVGSIVNLTANITEQNGDKVTSGRVIFKVNGKTLKDENDNTLYAPVSDGRATITYKVQEIWMKNTTYAEAVYSGVDNYASARTNTSDIMNISRGKTAITLEKTEISAKSGENITLRAKIVDVNGDRINTGKVVFKLNGKSITDEKGNILYAKVVNGEAVLEYMIPSVYSAKTYKLTAVYGGGSYERSEEKANLTIYKKGVTINTDNISTENGKTTVKATITDETGELLVISTKLTVKINGKTILTGVNSTDGKIDVSFTTTLRQGLYELMIISGENGIYKTGRMTTVLKI